MLLAALQIIKRGVARKKVLSNEDIFHLIIFHSTLSFTLQTSAALIPELKVAMSLLS